MDVFSWTGPRGQAIGTVTPRQPGAPNPPGKPGGGSGGGGNNPPPRAGGPTTPATGADLWLFALAATMLPAAVVVRRRFARA